MGSRERERENGNGGCRSPGDPKLGDGGMIVVESEAMKKRRASMLPLEVGTRVMCRWKDSKYYPARVIERRKMHSTDPKYYNYYVYYTNFNWKILDWVKLEQLDLNSVETVVEEKVEDKLMIEGGGQGYKIENDRPHLKRKIDEIHVEEPIEDVPQHG